MDRNIIFYFSGTGNSLKLARDIAGTIGNTDIVFMEDGFPANQHYDRVGFVFPCYAGGAPKIVLDFIHRLNLKAISPSAYFFVVVSCNAWGGNSAHMINSLLVKKGFHLHYANAVPTVGNYIAKYHPEKSFIDNSLERTLQEANIKSAEIAGAIREKKILSPEKWSLRKAVFYKAGNVYFRIMAKKLAITDKCINCGVCVKICPANNICAGKGKPVFRNKNCAQCMACLQWCPQKAIECGDLTAARNRYHHPDISLQDMIRRGVHSGRKDFYV
jgi:ferredoxin/flavodoxin